MHLLVTVKLPPWQTCHPIIKSVWLWALRQRNCWEFFQTFHVILKSCCFLWTHSLQLLQSPQSWPVSHLVVTHLHDCSATDTKNCSHIEGSEKGVDKLRKVLLNIYYRWDSGVVETCLLPTAIWFFCFIPSCRSRSSARWAGNPWEALKKKQPIC